jgi:phytoene/squalene synthetase
VARDLAIGRVYLPAEDRRRFGYSDADLEAGRLTPAFADLLRFEVDRTRALFQKGQPLVNLVPAAYRADIDLFIRGGQAILRRIELGRYNVWAARPTLAKWDKAALLGCALWQRFRGAFL